LKKQVRFSYKHIACDTFSSIGWILDIVFCLLNLIVVSIFLTLCGETLRSISSLLDQLGWVMVSAGILLALMVLVPNLDKMAWLNGLGIVNAIICAIAICVVSIIKMVYYREELTAGFLSYKFFD